MQSFTIVRCQALTDVFSVFGAKLRVAHDLGYLATLEEDHSEERCHASPSSKTTHRYLSLRQQ